MLRNKLGLRTKTAIDRAEFTALLTAQERYLSIVDESTVFATEVICRMHHAWLSGIYEWAGQFRSVELAKGPFAWPPARLVRQNMAQIQADTLRRHTPCRPGPLPAVAAAMAAVQADLLLVHPFREGNGRISRWVCDLMAMQAGLPSLDYGFTGPGSTGQRQTYLRAVLRGYGSDYEPLARLLAAAVERALARRDRG